MVQEEWRARQVRCDGYITHVVSLDVEPVEDEFYYGRNIAVALSGNNAHLIAAAPELLAACEAALDWFVSVAADGAPATTIRAAIRKAKGNE